MSYPEDIKIILVKEYEGGKTVAEISESVHIPVNSIYRWIREYKTLPCGADSYSPSEYRKLQKHSTKADHLLEIIRLAGCIQTISLKKKLEILENIHNAHDKYSIHELCEAMEVDRGTFYNHIFRRRDTHWRDEKEKRLMIVVQQVFEDNRQRFGAERIAKVMNANGFSINKEHVLRIMHELGIEAITVGAKKAYKQKREQHINRVRREFSVDKPNTVWVSDITYFKCCDNNMYLCVVIDLFSRMVVGYTISHSPSKQIASSALKKAVLFRGPEKGLTFHSDRGGQYISNSFQNHLRSYGMLQSLSGSGQPYDNAVAEAFFATIKKEELYRHDYRSISEFKASVASYIDFYNKTRGHSFLGYLSPEQFETKFYHEK